MPGEVLPHTATPRVEEGPGDAAERRTDASALFDAWADAERIPAFGRSQIRRAWLAGYAEAATPIPSQTPAMPDEVPPRARVAELADRLRSDGHHVTPGNHIDEVAVAALLMVAARTVREWRRTDTGPPYYHLARPLYRLDEVLEWLDLRRRGP